MSTMISEVYDALLAAGAPEDKARKAAEVLAHYDDRFAKIESDIATLRTETRGEFNLVRWMIGFNLAMTVAILWKVFS
jgi:hypothetical protein